jgi:hypothetical protein
MAGPEYAALGSFASHLGEAFQSRIAEQREDKIVKRQQWLKCVMSGNSPDACSQMLGYEPEGTELAGARTMQTSATAAATEAERRKQFSALQPEEQVAAQTQPIMSSLPSLRLPGGAREPFGTQREIGALRTPDMVPPDFMGRVAEYRKRREAVKARDEASAKLAAEERAEKRAIGAEKRRAELDIETAQRKKKLGLIAGATEKPTQLDKDKDYVRRRLTTMITSAISKRAEQGETISKALAIKTPEVQDVLAELRPVYPQAVEEILAEMGVTEAIEIPPSLRAELENYGSYEEWYNSLFPADQSLITPEEERAIKRYYGAF